MVRGFCIFLVVSLSCLFVLSDCGKKEVPVLRVMDSVNNKLVVLTGDRTKLSKFYNADFVILGGSLGGIAAALSICASGRTAILVEETDRIAGCFSLQDTSYFAENRYVETSGSSRTYQMFRSKIKDWYAQRSQPPPDIFPNLYPSLREFGSKSFCFETEAALDAINQMLEKRIQRESLTVVKRHKVAKAITFKNRIASLIAVDLDEMTATQFTGWMFIDATKNGDLIPLLGPDYTIGRESKAETGEPHAPDAPDTLSAREVFYYRDIRESDSERESAQHYTIDLQKNPEARDNMVPWVVMKEPCRIKGYRRIVEQDISAEFNKGPRARFFRDSVGIGFQPLIIDRPGGDSDKLVIETRPFQIPLGALVTKNRSNFLVGGATLSTTFITNTAYDTPSVEWAIGEAAGEAAAYCAGLKIYLDVLATTESHILGLQEWLVRKRGVPIYWYDDVTPHDKDFVRAQLHPFRDPSYNTSSRTLDYHDNPSHSRR